MKSARIAWFRVVDAQGVSYGSLYERVAKLDPHASFMSEQIAATLMRAGSERFVFKWPRPADASPALAWWNDLNKTRFQLHASACYCTIFDECKTTEFGDSHPQSVDSCESASRGRK